MPTRSASFAVLAFASVAGSLAAASATADTLVSHELRVTSSAAFETTPTLGADSEGRLVASTSRDFNSSPTPSGEVYYQRLDATGTVGSAVLVSIGGTDDQLNDVSGDFIVYTAYISPSSDLGEIKLYQVSTGSTSTISELTTALEGRVNGNRVAWVEGTGGATRVMLIDLPALARGERPLTLAGPTPPASDVEIGNTLVVWMVRRGTQLDVQAYDTRTGTVLDIAADPSVSERSPSTSGPWVTWQTSGGSIVGVRIEAYNVDTHEHRLVVENGASNLSPTIDGDVIAYESNVSGNFEVYLYRLSTGETFRATNHPADQRLNNVYGDMVAYIDSRDGNSDVFVTAFTFVDQPPTVSCPAGQVASNDRGQAGAVVDYPMPSAADDNPGATVTCAPPSGSTFPLGVTPVSCTATDSGGYTSACSFTVTVNDIEAPVVTAPPSLTVEATSPAGAVVSDAHLGEATASDNAPGVVLTRSGVPDGNLFPLGATTVTYTAVDGPGNMAVAHQTVTVRDTSHDACPSTSPFARRTDEIRLTQDGQAVGPALTVLGTGQYGLAWTNMRSANGEIRFRGLGSLGSPTSPEVLVARPFTSPGLVKDPAVGVASQGDFGVVWVDQAHGTVTLASAVFTPFGQQRLLDRPLVGSSLDKATPVLARGFAGNTLLAYLTLVDPGGTARLRLRILPNSSFGSTSESLDLTDGRAPVSGVSVAAGVTRYLVSYVEDGTAKFAIIEDATGAPVLVSGPTVISSNALNETSAAYLGSTNQFGVAFSAAEGGGIWAARVDAAGFALVEPPRVLVGGQSADPELAALPGEYGLAYTDRSSSPSRIMFHRLAPDLTPVGESVLVSTNTSGDASRPAIVARNDYYSLAWQDGRNGGSDVYFTGRVACGPAPDTEPPVVTCPSDITVSTDPGLATAVVSFAVTATDNAPGVTTVVAPPSGSTFPLGRTTVTATATDAAGNSASCSFILTVNDTEPPVVTAPADRTAEATSPAGAVVGDAELGSAIATDNVPGVTVNRSGVPAGNLFPLGTTVVTYTATDAAGNSASATQRVTVRDTTPPMITINAPTGVTYALNQAFAARYVCTDTVSAVTSCAGPVPSGSNFDTASVGSKTFTVNAADTAGNSASRSVTYTVGYRTCLLYDPNRAAKAGSTMPIRIQLCDAAGANVSASTIVVTAVRLARLSDATAAVVEDAGNANPDANFRYDPGLGGTGGYIFNLSTAGLMTGTYALVWTATGDPMTHSSEVTFQVK